jgi:hypothetical protein
VLADWTSLDGAHRQEDDQGVVSPLMATLLRPCLLETSVTALLSHNVIAARVVKELEEQLRRTSTLRVSKVFHDRRGSSRGCRQSRFETPGGTVGR